MRSLFIIIPCLTSAILIVTILSASVDNEALKHNSFYRKFSEQSLIKLNTLDIYYDSYYLAGTDSTHIYLGNYTAPMHLLVVNTSLTDTTHVNLQLEKFIYALRGLNIQVKPPSFYMTNGSLPVILKGTVDDWQAHQLMPDLLNHDIVYFTDIVKLDSTCFAIRAMSTSGENILARLTFNPLHVQFHPELLDRQIDGVFCTDGMLHYDPIKERIIYVYYYRNQYIVMDTHLNLLQMGNTIDSISQARIRVDQITSTNSITLSAPPLLVNKKSCVSNGLLYVNSGLLARNEKLENFEQNAVIDIYHLESSVYLLSLYIPLIEKQNIKSFRVIRNSIYVLHDKVLIKYQLPSLWPSAQTVIEDLLPAGKASPRT